MRDRVKTHLDDLILLEEILIEEFNTGLQHDYEYIEAWISVDSRRGVLIFLRYWPCSKTKVRSSEADEFFQESVLYEYDFQLRTIKAYTNNDRVLTHIKKTLHRFQMI